MDNRSKYWCKRRVRLTTRLKGQKTVGFCSSLHMHKCQLKTLTIETTNALPPNHGDARNCASYTYPYRTKTNGEHSEKHNGVGVSIKLI